MQDPHNILPDPPTLADLVRSLGKRSNVVPEAMRLLTERGHEYSFSTIYSTIRRNGTNNAVIEAALLDAIATERQARAERSARRQAVAAT